MAYLFAEELVAFGLVGVGLLVEEGGFLGLPGDFVGGGGRGCGCGFGGHLDMI